MFSRFWKYLLWLYYWLTGQEAVRLNLRVNAHLIVGGPGRRWTHTPIRHGGPFEVDGADMAQIGDTFTATIKPTNAAGNPAPVTNVIFDADVSGASYEIVSVAADGLSCVLVAKFPGVLNIIQAEALSKGGVALSQQVALPDVESPPVDEEAVALNLTVA